MIMTANPVTKSSPLQSRRGRCGIAIWIHCTGIGVAVIDSGIAAHPDLNNASGTSRVVYSQSFVSGNTSAVDQYGHGTHVAGLTGPPEKSSAAQ